MAALRATVRATTLIVFACLPATAQAREYYYYNKSGVSRDVYVADVKECAELVGGAGTNVGRTGPYYVSVPNTQAGMYGFAIASFFMPLIAGAERRAERNRLKNGTERICMADKGYARMQVDKSLIVEIEKMADQQARVDRLFDLAASSHPIGKRIKE